MTAKEAVVRMYCCLMGTQENSLNHSDMCQIRAMEVCVQQAIDAATLPFREFANDFLDWDGEVEPHRTRMQLADMARRLLDLPCAQSEQSRVETEQEK